MIINNNNNNNDNNNNNNKRLHVNGTNVFTWVLRWPRDRQFFSVTEPLHLTKKLNELFEYNGESMVQGILF